MLYLSLKAVHIVVVIAWVGALALLCFVTSTSRFDSAQLRASARVTEAAIGLTWVSGIALAIMGSWYASTWWYIKVFLVIVVSAIHTIHHRRWKSSAATAATTHSLVAPAVWMLALMIVLLVTFKRPV